MFNNHRKQQMLTAELERRDGARRHLTTPPGRYRRATLPEGRGVS